MKVKNLLIKYSILLVKKWRKEKTESLPAKRFLIVSTTALGDTIWATPSIKALRDKYPGAFIAVLTSSIGKEVLENNPHLDEIYVAKKSLFFSLLKLLLPLRKKKFHTIFIFHLSQRAILPFCFFLDARQIIGNAGMSKDQDFILTKALPVKPVHEIERRLELVAEVKARAQEPKLELFLSKKDVHAANLFLQSKGISSLYPFIGIHPGSKDKFKQWPIESFIEVGNLFAESIGAQVLLTGSLQEKDLLVSMAAKIRGAVALTDPVSVKVLAALIKQMSFFITNDTGPMHVAFAMNTSTVALFAPTNSRLCGPLHCENVIVLQKEKTCTPCLRKKCSLPFCLMQISPEDVVQAGMQLFYKKGLS